MKKVILLTAIYLSCFFTVLSQKIDIDPKYPQTFGYGVIIASINGYPKYDQYDESQFIYKDGLFLVQNDEKSTLDLRVILPKGMTEGKLVEKLKKEKPHNLKSKKAEYSVWQLWVSHETYGKENITERTPWPTDLTSTPMWSAPYNEKFYNAGESSKNFVTAGYKWEDGMNTSIGNWLAYAKPGYKIYAVYRVCYEYSVPGGQMETKWDANLKKWYQQKSTGGIGYIYSDPIAAASIVVYGEDISDDRFKDNGDGTVTDTKTGLMWQKSPSTREKFWNEAVEMAKECTDGNYSDWRLPTATELTVMMKISKAKDEQYKCEWLNQHGFTNILPSSYWTSDPYIRDGQKTEDKIGVDMQYKIVGGSGINYNKNVWFVRTPK